MKLLNMAMCLLGKHRYHPHYSVRQVRFRKSNRLSHHEFQMQCACCGTKTKWEKLSKLDKFTKSLGGRYGWGF